MVCGDGHGDWVAADVRVRGGGGGGGSCGGGWAESETRVIEVDGCGADEGLEGFGVSVVVVRGCAAAGGDAAVETGVGS